MAQLCTQRYIGVCLLPVRCRNRCSALCGRALRRRRAPRRAPNILAPRTSVPTMLCTLQVKLEVDRAFAAGEPLAAWCGPQPNSRLLINYGLVDENNPYDKLPLSSECPLPHVSIHVPIYLSANPKGSLLGWLQRKQITAGSRLQMAFRGPRAARCPVAL